MLVYYYYHFISYPGWTKSTKLNQTNDFFRLLLSVDIFFSLFIHTVIECDTSFYETSQISLSAMVFLWLCLFGTLHLTIPQHTPAAYTVSLFVGAVCVFWCFFPSRLCLAGMMICHDCAYTLCNIQAQHIFRQFRTQLMWYVVYLFVRSYVRVANILSVDRISSLLSPGIQIFFVSIPSLSISVSSLHCAFASDHTTGSFRFVLI